MLSKLVITCLPRSKHLLISWLQSPSAVILEPKKIKFLTVCTVQFSRSVMSISLWPHEPQHAKSPCPSPTQTHVCWVSDAIQPSYPPLSTSPPALNLSQLQGLFNWISYSHQVAKVLEFQRQQQSFNENPGLIFLQPKGLSGVFSSTTIWRHQFFGTQPSLWSNSHIHTWLLEKP